MPFGNNNQLFTTGNRIEVANNVVNDAYALDGSRANQLVFSAGSTGDDVFTGFGANDTLINYKQLSPDFLQFGANGIVDIDRVGEQPGADQINLVGLNSHELRYLGSRAGSGQYVYADAATLRQLVATFGADHVTDSAVTSETFDAAHDGHVYLFDTALGLNLGGDTIQGFGSDDLLVTTSAIFNGRSGDPSSMLSFGKNGVLDLSGEYANSAGDSGADHGGQVALAGVDGLFLVGTQTGANGATYYFYSTESTPS